MFGDIKQNSNAGLLADESDLKKIYKINYKLNIIPSIGQVGTSLMDICGQTEELEIFHT